MHQAEFYPSAAWYINLSISVAPFLFQKQVTNLEPLLTYLEQNSQFLSSKIQLLQNAAGPEPGRGDVGWSGASLETIVRNTIKNCEKLQPIRAD